MPGLLDALQGLGTNPLFALGTGLLSQSGYSTTPVTVGQALGQGFQNVQQAGLLASQNRLRQAQMTEMQRRAEAEQAAQEQAQAQQEAQVQALMQGGMPESRARTLVTAGMGERFIQPPPGPPEPTTLARNLEAAGLAPGSPEFQSAMMAAVTKPLVQMPSPGFEPQTAEGKALMDLQELQQLPPSEERDRAISAIRAKLAKAVAPPAQQAERETKFAAALNAAERLNKLADENPLVTGPIEGRIARKQAELGAGTKEGGAMAQLEATMKSQLGTALSGAAIPPSEWPTYMMQIPLMTDSKEVREGKLEQFRETMRFLEERAKEFRGQTPTAEQGLLAPTPSPIGTTPAAPLRIETQKPTGMSDTDWDELQRLRRTQGG